MAANEYNCILIAPPPEMSNATLQVEGVFYSEKLTDDDDENFWSTNHAYTLIHAALREIERLYRNREGVKDWSDAIDSVLVPLNMDTVEEEISEVNEMQG